jgi:hypothetical protein
MRDTHTHKGHCQACGRTQAVSTDGSLIAKHGYDVQFGFFNGTCNGSDNKPLEIEKTLAENTIQYLRDYVIEGKKALSNFKGVSSVNVMYKHSKGIKKLESIPAYKVERVKEDDYSVEKISVSEISDVINNCSYLYGSHYNDYKYDRSTTEEIIQEANTLWVKDKKESMNGAIHHISFLQELIERVHGNALINVADGKKLLVNMETEVAEGFNDYEVVENQYGKSRNYLAGYQKSITKSVSIGDITLTITRQRSIYTRRSTSYRCAFSLNGKKIAKNKLLETMGVA